LAATELTAVPITREGLLKLQKRKTLALAILDLLQKDLDVLVKGFFRLVEKAEEARSRFYEALREAYEVYAEAKMVLGTRRFEQLTLEAVENMLSVDVKEERMAGVRLLNVLIPSMRLVERRIRSPVYDVLDTSVRLDDAVAMAREALKALVELAEAEAAMSIVVQAMQVTRKRINMIQYRFIPDIDRTMRYIESILEERAREDTTRLRVLQRKRKMRSAARAS